MCGFISLPQSKGRDLIIVYIFYYLHIQIAIFSDLYGICSV